MKLTAYESECIVEIHRLMSAQIASHPRLNDLLTEYSISPLKFKKGFKERYGVTPARFHLEKSMEYGKELLRGGAQVKFVALKLGYSTTGSFTRAFRRVYPHPPVSYRYNEYNTGI